MTQTNKWQKDVNYHNIDLNEFDDLTIDEVIKKINDLKEIIPESYEHYLYYFEDDNGGCFEMKTFRYETDEEEQARIEFISNITEKSDIQEYKRIKEKYNL